MATIPNVERDRIIPQPSRDVAPHEAGIFGRALQQVGRSVSGMGAELKQQAEQEQRRLEEAQADAAINKTLSDQMELRAGQPSEGSKGGYLYQRSSAVVQPGLSGKNFLDDYNTQFEAKLTSNGAQLTRRAKEKYDSAVGRMRLDFQAGLLSHSLRETDDYYTQVHASTMSAEAQNAGASWGNPAAVAESLKRASEATLREAERRGNVDIAGAQQEAVATVIDSAARGALASGNSKAAEDYLNEYKDIMPAKMAQSLATAVGHARGQEIALVTAEKVSNAMKHRVLPTDFDRAAALLGSQTKEDTTRFNDLTKKYGGDIEKAWAAYQVGPKEIDDAVKRADRSAKLNQKDPNVQRFDWIDLIPKEARASVEGKRKTFAAGGGVTEPSRLEAEEMAVRIARADNPNATPEQLNAAREKAGQWFADLKTARAQTEENTLLEVQRLVDTGRIRTANDVAPQMKSMLGGKWVSAQSYINGAQERQDKVVQASPVAREFQDRLMSSPELLVDTPVAEIMALGTDLGNKNVQALLNRRSEYINDPAKVTAAKVDADQFESAIAPYLKGVSKDGRTLFKHQVRAKVEEEIAYRKSQGESGMAVYKDLNSIILKYATFYPVEKPGFLFGTNTEQVPGALLPQGYTLPPDEAAKIDAKAAKLGMRNLSDDDRMRIYRKMQAAEAAD